MDPPAVATVLWVKEASESWSISKVWEIGNEQQYSNTKHWSQSATKRKTIKETNYCVRTPIYNILFQYSKQVRFKFIVQKSLIQYTFVDLIIFSSQLYTGYIPYLYSSIYLQYLRTQ